MQNKTPSKFQILKSKTEGKQKACPHVLQLLEVISANKREWASNSLVFLYRGDPECRHRRTMALRIAKLRKQLANYLAKTLVQSCHMELVNLCDPVCWTMNHNLVTPCFRHEFSARFVHIQWVSIVWCKICYQIKILQTPKEEPLVLRTSTLKSKRFRCEMNCACHFLQNCSDEI